MNQLLKYGLIFVGGLIVGALGSKAAQNKDFSLKPFATDLLSRGMDVKDAVMGKVETMKEGMDDLTAEARYAAEQRKEQQENATEKTNA